MTAKSDVTTPPWVDPEDAPELTEAQLATADLYEGDKFIRRVGGRPKGSGSKELVSLRLDRDILDHFRNGGPGWQTRINDALRAALKPSRRTARRAPGTQAAPAVDAADLVLRRSSVRTGAPTK
jgi:uncharacterized protein (DUF4415 family)